jgi:hypothetical protein
MFQRGKRKQGRNALLFAVCGKKTQKSKNEHFDLKYEIKSQIFVAKIQKWDIIKADGRCV